MIAEVHIALTKITTYSNTVYIIDCTKHLLWIGDVAC